VVLEQTAPDANMVHWTTRIQLMKCNIVVNRCGAKQD